MGNRPNRLRETNNFHALSLSLSLSPTNIKYYIAQITNTFVLIRLSPTPILLFSSSFLALLLCTTFSKAIIVKVQEDFDGLTQYTALPSTLSSAMSCQTHRLCDRSTALNTSTLSSAMHWMPLFESLLPLPLPHSGSPFDYSF